MGMFLRRGPAPSLGTPVGSLAVGSKIKLNVNDVSKEFLIVHQGVPSSIYDASCDGTWLLMKDIYENRAWNSGGAAKYAESSINTWLNGDFLGLLDDNVQSAIKQVKIPYTTYVSGGETKVGENGLPCKAFLLSAPEVHFSYSGVASNEGATLDYFASASQSSADSLRIAYLNGAAAVWWLRSPYTRAYYQYAWIMSELGVGQYNGRYVSMAYGIRPAFILLSDFKVADDMIAT